MTLSPVGSHLAPHDLPPPPPSQDPREPPSSTPRRTGASTPQRPISPAASRGASPQRSSSISNSGVSHVLGTGMDRTPSHDLMSGSTPHLHSPTPRHASAGHALGSAHPHPIPHHLSRPSSPSSIHSSTSAIFERDIEHPSTASSLSLNPAATPVNPSLSHKPSRLGFVHGSALDHSVPAVLDDAVEALTATSRGLDGLEIEAPAPVAGGGGVGMTRVASGMSGRKVSSPAPLAGLMGLGQSHHSGASSPVSANSSITSPAQSPPILAQLGTGSGLLGVKGQSGISPSTTESKSPFDDRSVPAPTTEPLKDKSADTLQPNPVRPAAMTRMSTGRQVPGGWLSAWTKEEADAQAEAVEMGEGHPHPGPGEAGVGLERTAGILGEQEKVISLDELPPAALINTASSARSPSSPPVSAIPPHLNPSSSSTSLPGVHSNNDAKRRISFISPNDLILSVPTSVTSLGEIASGNLSPEHLHMDIASGSPAMGRSPRMSTTGEDEGGAGMKSGMWGKENGSMVAGEGVVMGEWVREGLGRGLEQRLEELEMATASQGAGAGTSH